jgi:hypothetical protein
MGSAEVLDMPEAEGFEGIAKLAGAGAGTMAGRG